MKIAQMELIKRCTDDGLVEVNDDVPLGKRYLVDLDEIITTAFLHVPSNTPHVKQVIKVVGDDGYLPVELFKFIELKEN